MENKNVRTIGVLTSGGDAPGMNAAIRSVVRVGSYYGLKVFGVRRGYNGLINGELEEMNARSVSEILQRGGTILQTARCLEFKEEAGVKKAVEIAKVFGLDGLVVVGGDGSFRGARDLCAAGLPTIALPGTIDNDISCSEYTVGYDTCLNTVKDAVDKIRDTAQSHERCSIIEVMGRAAGYIAIQAGIACGAEVILVPERKWSFDEDVLRPILESKSRGRKHSIISLPKVSAVLLKWLKKSKKRQALNQELLFLVMFKEAAVRQFVTELWQVKWVVRRLSFYLKVSRTESYVCNNMKLLMLILKKVLQ